MSRRDILIAQGTQSIADGGFFTILDCRAAAGALPLSYEILAFQWSASAEAGAAIVFEWIDDNGITHQSMRPNPTGTLSGTFISSIKTQGHHLFIHHGGTDSIVRLRDALLPMVFPRGFMMRLQNAGGGATPITMAYELVYARHHHPGLNKGKS